MHKDEAELLDIINHRIKPKHVYHYMITAGNVAVDGILRLDERIMNQEIYMIIKDLIAEVNDVERENMIVRSLSYFGLEY